MPVAYPSGALRRPSNAADLLVLAATTLLVVAGLLGVVPPLAAVALAGAAGSVLAGIRLSRLSVPDLPATPDRPAVPDHLASPARPVVPHRRSARCRPIAGLLDAAVATVGLTVAVLPLVGVDLRAAVGAAGFALAALPQTAGLLLLPGRSRLSHRARLRRAVDVVGLGLSLAFAGWVLLLALGQATTAARVAAVAAGFGFGFAAIGVTALAHWRRRPGRANCLLGAGAAHLGLLGLIVLLAHDAPERALLVTVAPLVAGALLTADGVRRVAAGDPPRPDGPPPRWPRITAPAVVAALAAAGHLAARGEFRPGTVLLGLAVIPPLVVRELISNTDNRRYAARLAAQEAQLRALVSGGHDLIMLLDDALRVRWQSPAATRLFALTDAEVLGHPFTALLHPEDVPRATRLLDGVRAGAQPTLLPARLRDGHGAWRQTESTISDQRDVPEVHALVLHVRDVGERRRLEPAVHQLAAPDQLTGLANRRELVRELDARRNGPGTLLVVGLHGLGEVADDHGHAGGDAAVVEAARRLRAAVGCDDVLARLAADEFAVVTTAGSVLAYALGARLLEMLGVPYQVAGGEVRLRASVGLAELSGAAAANDVLRQADLARHRAAQLGRDRIEWYDAYLEEQFVRRLDLERALPGAVARGELDLVYQPVLGLADRLPVGAEALLRWRSPVLGTVAPAELLPVARDLDLLGEVGRWVLDRACRQLADWSAGGRQLWMSVNVTPQELTAPDFLQRTAAVLATHGVSPDRLVIEVAEPSIGAELNTVVARLAGLRSLGVRTALDDFRAAHSSLARLRRLPIDLLKLAPRRVDASDAQHPLTEVVVRLGDRLGLEVVAAELETPAQVEAAYRAGCRYGQGFALARPATAERVEAYLEEFPSASR
ncbi:putative bifunctional diguanylate cyclase/phosphodiesterase [Micromonospora sp. DT233]|uniref:putative bifunctional diguanylate cyclase/phosphodiesterase n=1 Tax=Micromonospora sp. DT233 TaxID=3393432 RepID=UPI003CF1468B